MSPTAMPPATPRRITPPTHISLFTAASACEAQAFGRGVFAMRLRQCHLLAIAILAPSAAYAAPEPTPLPSEIRLSQEEIDKVLEEAARKREHPHQAGEDPKRQV